MDMIGAKVLSTAEVADLREFTDAVMRLFEGNAALAGELEDLALTAAEILDMLDPSEDEEDL